jgi:hypothetical protein
MHTYTERVCFGHFASSEDASSEGAWHNCVRPWPRRFLEQIHTYIYVHTHPYTHEDMYIHHGAHLEARAISGIGVLF